MDRSGNAAFFAARDRRLRVYWISESFMSASAVPMVQAAGSREKYASLAPAVRYRWRYSWYTALPRYPAAALMAALSFSLPSRPNSTPTAPESSLLWSVASTLPWRMLPGSAAFRISCSVSMFPSRDRVLPRMKSAETW